MLREACHNTILRDAVSGISVNKRTDKPTEYYKIVKCTDTHRQVSYDFINILDKWPFFFNDDFINYFV